MKCLSEGEYFDQITEKFDGDEQLVKLWMSFLLHNKCIQNPLDHKWVVTEKGKRWMNKYELTSGKTNPFLFLFCLNLAISISFAESCKAVNC
jgi:hypothetical protein